MTTAGSTGSIDFSKVRMLRDRVLLKMLERKSGLLWQAQPEWPWEKVCEVVNIGPDVDLEIEVGDLVVLKYYTGDPVENRFWGHLTVKAECIIGKVDSVEGTIVYGNPRDNW